MRLIDCVRIFCVGASLQLAGCAIQPSTLDGTAPASADATAYLRRADAEVQTRENVEVRVAVLSAAESAAVFGLPLADKGIQPVWVNIHNRSGAPYWFMPVFLDRDFFSALEVAYLFHSGQSARDLAIERTLTQRQIRVHIPAGGTSSGFVFTNLTRGIELVNVELAGSRRLLRFSFARELAGAEFDYQAIERKVPYPRERVSDVAVAELGRTLGALACCTTDASGRNPGDPLNIAMVGEQHELLVALVRGGWDFTETIHASSVAHMVESFATGAPYRNSPVSPLYFDGRHQDFALQRARSTISQRNHLRLGRMPLLRVEGQPLWIGQISRDIGVRMTWKTPFFTTHKIDPDVDEAREYLLQDLLMANAVARWGLVSGVGPATADAPRRNLTGDPYFTDGQRLVLFISPAPRAIPEVEVLEWRPTVEPLGRSHKR